MSSALLFVMSLGSTCLVLLLCLPWVIGSSPEAERMFLLVRSTREDKRRISRSERGIELFVRLIRSVRNRLGGAKNEQMTKRFTEAGMRGTNLPDVFLLTQCFLLLIGGLVGSLLLSGSFFWVIAGGAIGFMAPDFWLGAMQKRRRNRIRRSVPDMVDLLVICVGAGLGMDQAILRVTEELRLSYPDTADELDRVMLERRAGVSRIDAWRALAERTNVQEFAAFVSMLSETDRFGSPIMKALNDFSEEIRTKRRQKAEEAAAKTKVKIIFPLVICIFPCIFIVLLAPAILAFMHGFSSMGR